MHQTLYLFLSENFYVDLFSIVVVFVGHDLYLWAISVTQEEDTNLVAISTGMLTTLPSMHVNFSSSSKQPVTWATLIEVLHELNSPTSLVILGPPSVLVQWNGCMEIYNLYIQSYALCLSCVPYPHISVSFCVYKSFFLYFLFFFTE